MSSDNSRVFCRFYATPGGCWYGDKCRFSHSQLHAKSTENRPFCTYFMSGNCRFGSSCFNRHAPVEYELRTQDLNDIDSSPSNMTNSEGEQQEECSGASACSSEAAQSTPDTSQSEADLSRSSEECVKPRRKPTDITCGQCGVHYEGVDAYDKLKDHYLENLKRMDGKHTTFLSRGKFRKYAICGECDGREFVNAHAFLQHIVAKSKVPSKSQREHFNDLDCVAQMFVDRDAGNDSHKDFISFLCDYLTAFGDDSDDETGLNDIDNIDFISHKFTVLNPFAADFDDDDDDDGGMFGFSEDDVFELLCQGIKPWDDEAGAALAVLNGYDY